ncbi:peptidoglycan bridge formation glycyltransferase FemA/FemB family protein [Candidatus Saccharibacteria bacterium TM7i]|nr:peptidoglycan bridge formation glycyltransferase FemA/FemB family protein [Candidatus Saccharibacteria bacterium TM7i]
MITVRECNNAQDWDECVVDGEGHPLQLWGWGEVKQRHGWSVDRLLFEEGDELLGGLQVLTKKLPLPFRAFSYVPRGQIFHVKNEEILNSAANYIKSKYKGIALSIEPDALAFDKPEGWVRATNKILPAETVLLDISHSEEELQSVMAKKTRQYIRKSAKEVEIRQVTSVEELEKCLDLYKETSKRAGFALHDEVYYKDVFTLLADHSPVFAAYKDGQPVAFLWLAISGATAYELYGGMNGIGQQLRANYALKWHAITKVKQWGLTKYDFGGIVAGGVATFKQGWVSDTTFFAGTYDKPLSPLYILWSHALPFAKKTAQKLRSVMKR